jgi:hypothetical protein
MKNIKILSLDDYRKTPITKLQDERRKVRAYFSKFPSHLKYEYMQRYLRWNSIASSA